VDEGTWLTPLEGDVLQKEDSGGLFLCADVQADRDRAARGEVSPTGPMVGIKMRAPTGAPLALETEVTTAWLGEGFDLASVRHLGEGTRRPLRTLVSELRVEIMRNEAAVHVARPHSSPSSESAAERDAPGEQAPSVRVYFVLPKGAYATTVLATAIEIDTCATDEVNSPGASASPAEPNEAHTQASAAESVERTQASRGDRETR